MVITDRSMTTRPRFTNLSNLRAAVAAETIGSLPDEFKFEIFFTQQCESIIISKCINYIYG